MSNYFRVHRRRLALAASLCVTVSPLSAVTPMQLAQQAYLKASIVEPSQRFGYSVAVAGNTVVVGTPDQGVNGSGAAYVFVRVGTSWSQQAYLQASNPDAFDRFGWSVAVSGDTIVIGAPGESSAATGVNGAQGNAPGGTGSGAAYVFVRTGTTWTQQAYLKSANSDAGDSFGWSVGVSGQTVVVGANQEDSHATGVNGDGSNNGADRSGAAYVFVGVRTNWTQQAYLKASNTGTTDGFGFSVAAAGEFVVVGAPEEDSNFTQIQNTPLLTPEQTNNTATSSGAAYIFGRSGTNWTQRAYLKAFNAEASDSFGISVAISGNTVAVGAWQEDSASSLNGPGGDNGAVNSGAAYVFVRSGTPAAWSQQAYLKASNREAGDFFGGSVAISGDAVVVGASREDSNARGVNPAFGSSDNSAPSAGAAYVFVRTNTPAHWRQLAYLKASNSDAADFFGYSAGISEDLVVVGAYAEDGIEIESGAAYVFSEPTPVVPGYVSTPVPGSILDFGDIEDSSWRTIYMGNSGTNDLQIFSVELTSETPGLSVIAFADSQGGAVSFPWTIPRDSTNAGLRVEVSWTPQDGQSLNAAVRVTTSDPRIPEAFYSVAGTQYNVFGQSAEAVILQLIDSFYIGPEFQLPAALGGKTIRRSAAFRLSEPQTTTFVLDAEAAHVLDTEIPAHLGGGSVQLSNFTGSVTVSLLPIPGDPDRAFLRIENGSFYCPSFRLPSGLETGPNTLAFGSPEQSEGILWLTNGSYTVSTTATIVNHLVPEGVAVLGNYSGIYDMAMGRASLRSQSTDLFKASDRVRLGASDGGFWLAWASTNALEAAASILGPWRTVTNAVSPHLVVTTNQLQQFFRLRGSAP